MDIDPRLGERAEDRRCHPRDLSKVQTKTEIEQIFSWVATRWARISSRTSSISSSARSNRSIATQTVIEAPPPRSGAQEMKPTLISELPIASRIFPAIPGASGAP